ncbi:thymidylate synthase, flavin-dependent [Caldalkalibacillus thermarum TA2.A1]|uniref:FAD-dependent thymidylate synthase n=1 Tax=Caldalkalibacillus thermarum (strain TA2.A1) TaxID=986075 RepID=F5L7J8_CALTT|nr:thymidylate synthase, flavin-dependent [Caldalkalibacillus thermarum TA2.A1]GGK21976.1 flavin-dependent thymidylate synthase [Caldalkalibacillus thermarum]
MGTKTERKLEKIDVLDKGYVRLVDVMGDDLRVVNAARVSYAKESKQLSDKDIRLIKFLAREGHTSPFRHAMLSFEIYAPLMIARQWWKYVVGSDHVMDAWNEASRRYITMEPEWYIPDENAWRSKPDHSKQGSGEPVDRAIGREATQRLKRQLEEGLKDYEWALEAGIAPEQARLLLPSAYGMYTPWYWTASLQSVAHMLNQRLAHDAQAEFQAYARAVYELVKPYFEHSLAELLKNKEI